MITTKELSVVATEVELFERNGRTAADPEVAVVDLFVAGHRVHRGLRLLGGLDPDVAVPGQPGTGRDELTDDDVLLEAQQRVALAVDGGVGEHPGGLLEGGRRQPR